MPKPVHIPAFLNWRCICCGTCCTRFDITLSAAEQERLNGYPWTRWFPQLQGRQLFEPFSRGGAVQYRLPHEHESGACIFLENNRCLMHQKLGLEKKLYACQCYPYTFADTPSGIYVGLRFDCAGVGAPDAPTIMSDRESIERLARAFPDVSEKPPYASEMPLRSGLDRSWDELLELESVLMGLLLRTDAPIARRALAAALLLEHTTRANVADLSPGEFVDVIEVMAEACWDNADRLEPRRGGVKTGRHLARQLLGDLLLQAPPLYHDWPLRRKLGFRFSTFLRRITFVLRRGTLHTAEGQTVSISAAEQCRLEPDEDAARLLATYLAAKLFGKNHWGPLFHDYPFLPGAALLIAVYACVVTLARANALGRGEGRSLTVADMAEAVRSVDHRYGALKLFRSRPARLRARLLLEEGVLSGLIHDLHH